jgi:hypothetical protein
MTLITEPHEPTDECHEMHCYFHMIDEPDENAVLVCGECMHAFQTESEVVDAHNVIMREVSAAPVLAVTTSDVWACPLCTHDF